MVETKTLQQMVEDGEAVNLARCGQPRDWDGDYRLPAQFAHLAQRMPFVDLRVGEQVRWIGRRRSDDGHVRASFQVKFEMDDEGYETLFSW